VLKLMIDRLVSADGGNPDPTTTMGKRVKEATQLELDRVGARRTCWPLPVPRAP
jgi:hypothetical protein